MNLMNTLSAARKANTQNYLVEITFNDDVLGTQPKTEELMRKFVEMKLNREAKEAEKAGLQPPTEERRAEIMNLHLQRMFGAATVEETIEEEVERAHTTFFIDEAGPYIGNYQMKACIRDMCTTLGIFMQKRGSKQTFQHLLGIRACDHNGEPLPGEQGLRLHFWRDEEIVTEVDGWIEKTAHVMTAQGPRSVIKRHDQVFAATLRFLIMVPCNIEKNREKALIQDEEIAQIMLGAENNGLGCSRSQGHGTFRVTRLERVTNHPWIKGGARPDSAAAAAAK
ncbi:MAG: hypothetical protein EB075_13290 [Bacteroidetes bacterium]|nr:hypothetical protein [Bacteroidota bacterium]